MHRSQSKPAKIKWIAAHVGARMHYAVPEILHANQKLSLFFTDIYSRSGYLLRILSSLPNWLGWKKYFTRRSSYLPEEKVMSFLIFGLQYLFKFKRCKQPDCYYSVFVWAGKEFNRRIIGKLKNRNESFEAIYSFNSASLEIFTAYKGKKLLVLEQCIAPFSVEHKLLSREQSIHQGWTNLDQHSNYYKEYIKREEAELQLADAIICPSVFVEKSVVGINPQLKDKIHIVPYGVRLPSISEKKFSKEGPLRILSVGKAGLRKGTPYVLEAAMALKDKAQFRWVGDFDGIMNEVLERLLSNVEMTGQVSRHEIAEHYKWADIFLLPSVCEGSATVTYEAMQYGLPMIVTENTGSIIKDGRDGFIVSHGRADEIIDSILKFYTDRTLLETFSKNVTKLRHDGSYQAYSERLRDTLYQIEEEWRKQVQ